MKNAFRLSFTALACALAACAEIPSAPTVTVMPGPYKPFEVFQAEDQTCRGYAQQQVGGQTQGGAVNQGTATGAVAGTALGAAGGALIGQSAQAAGVGAGVGLLTGAAVGSSYGYDSAYYLQWRYNVAYEQCMYAKGNQIQGFAPPASVPPPANGQPPTNTPPPR
ncbi:MAG: hypothetical protein P4L83_17295 [Nevskia sp.]|nr:hypothetical protein [Nevskia sp.]